MDEYALPPAGPDENPLHLAGISETTPGSPESKTLLPLEIDVSERETELLPPMTPPVSKQIIMAEEKHKREEKSIKRHKSGPPKHATIKEESMEKMDVSEKSEADYKRHMKRSSKESKEIIDFSDPLQSYQKSQDESIFETKSKHTLQEEKRKVSHGFKKALDDVILSASPYLKSDVPYLETDSGANCKLRGYFPKDIYWSRHFSPQLTNEKRTSKFVDEEEERKKRRERELEAKMLPAHPFVSEKITSHVSEGKIQVRLLEG